MNLSSEKGTCKDCDAKIDPLGLFIRCSDCDEKFQVYVDTLWGLDVVIRERTRNELLGLCFHCGSGLKKNDDRLCEECQRSSQVGRWCKEMYRKGGKPTEENPYKSIWDSNEVDNSTYLTPTLDTMANRMLEKAQCYQRKSERGGPRGREYAQEAIIYFRIAKKLKDNYRKVAKFK